MSTFKKGITFVILAGGKSSRMGAEKGLLNSEKCTMVEHIADIARNFTDTIILIANNRKYTELGLPVYEDYIKDKGPMGGIYTGLRHAESELTVITACDMPSITSNVIENLLANTDNHDLIFYGNSNKIEPFPGVYKKSCMTSLMQLIEKNELSLQKLPQHFNTLFIPFCKDDKNQAGNPFFNMNSPEDFESFTRLEIEN